MWYKPSFLAGDCRANLNSKTLGHLMPKQRTVPSVTKSSDGTVTDDPLNRVSLA
jgi:hypothetical protein